MAHTAHQGQNFQTNPNTSPSHEAWKPSKKQKMWMGITAVTIAAVAAGGFGVAKGAQKLLNRAPVAEAPANPAVANPEKSAPAEVSYTAAEKAPAVPSVESLEISADQEPEEIAKAIVENINTMATENMTKEVYDRYHAETKDGSIDPTKWAEDYTKPYIEAHFTALYGNNYETKHNDEELTKNIILMTINHLDRYVRTMDANVPNPDYEPVNLPVYQYTMTFEKLVTSGEGTYNIYVHEVDNNMSTNLANTAWDQPSEDKHNILSFEVTKAKNNDGNEIIIIDSAKVTTITQ